MARLPGESVSVLLSRLMTEGLKLALLTALEGGCNLRQTRRKTLRNIVLIIRSWTYFWCIALATL